jgi:EmrB/QacA subfamily drug resistance transporter
MSQTQPVTSREARGDPGTTDGSHRRQGLALLVIAAAQLMVVLDATIVNVALPHIQRALGFSGNGLEWVITAYALSFGGLLLLGGRAGDILGRRPVLTAGLAVFSAASLAGGFATSQAWLLTTRAVQGAGAALIAPAILALIATTFADGPPRNKAIGVVAAISGAGGAAGLVAGGLLTTYLSWRWVLFVNVPIGALLAAAAPFVLTDSARLRGRFDLAGAVTGTAGVTLLVYGLSSAGASQSGISHWADPTAIASLTAAAVLLTVFVVVEARGRSPLLPPRILASPSRSGAYLVMLMVATAMFGIFFFLTIFVQAVLGYSALKTGIAFLPLASMITVVSTVASRQINRVGARPLVLAGATLAAGGMYWLSRISIHTSYSGGLLGPMLVIAAGLGMLFVPLSLTVINQIRPQDSGLASSLLSTGQQVGGAIGLAALGTLAWTTVAGSVRSHAARVPVAGHPGHSLASLHVQVLNYHQALATGFSRGFLAASAIAAASVLVAAATIRIRRAGPASTQPHPQEGE